MSGEMPVGLQSGASFGAFRVIEPLGRGGMASVFKAYEAALDRYVALKVLPAEFLHDPTFAERFRREAKVVARLEHPHIIPIYAFDIEGGVPWMAMRLISGGTLSTLLKAGTRMSHTESVTILRGVAAALDYAHSKGVVHRDVKPQNILLDEMQHVYLADFGIAKMVEGSAGLTQTGMIAGTPQYMAPEQATGKTVDHRADIYALGIVAYELLTGRVPFSADTPVAVLMKHLSDPVPLPSPDQVPEPLMRPLLKAMAKNPAERWSSAGAFTQELTKALVEAPTLQGQAVEEETALLHSTVPGQSVPLQPTLASRTPAPGTPVPAATVATPGLPTGVGSTAVAPAAATSVDGGPASPERSSMFTLVLVVAAIGLVVVGGGLIAAYLITRQPDEKVVTLAPTSTQTGVPPDSTGPANPPGNVAGAASSPPPGLTVASGAAVPSLPMTLASSRPTATLRLAPPPSEGPGTEPPSGTEWPTQTIQAVPTPHQMTPSTSLPVGPPGVPFSTDVKINLGNTVHGPLTLRAARFKANKGEVQAEVEIAVAEGKDLTIDVRVELLGASGDIVATLTGRGGIEEEETGTIRFKQRITKEVVATISSFRVSAAPATKK